jgi:hypothetical protein
MAYDPKEGMDHGNEADWPVTNGTTHEMGDPILLNTAAGTTVVASAAANRRFVGWMTGPGGSVTGVAALTERVRTHVGQVTKTNVLIVGTGASDTLTAADRGKDVFVTGANAYTVVPAANQVRVGTLSKIRSAGTSADGRGDIHWEGLAEESAGTAAGGAGAALVDLTDSSGLSGSHDDTVAAMAAIVTLTDNTGQSGTHDDTLAATTVPAALTVTDGAGTNDGTIGAITADASVIAAVQEIAAKIAAIITLLGVMVQNQSDVGQKVIELVTREQVAAQNISDVTQKVKELVAIAKGI